MKQKTNYYHSGDLATLGGTELRGSSVPVRLDDLAPGTVVWAHVPYRTGDGTKRRPAVVIARNGSTITVLPVTSAPSRRNHPDTHLEIEYLSAAGLTTWSGIKLGSVFIEIDAVTSVCGRLSDHDADRLRDAYDLPLGQIV